VNCFIYKQSKNWKLTHFFLDCKNIKIFSQNSKIMIKICTKTRGVKDFISSVGSRLASGNCHEPEEPIGVSKHENPPCFSRHLFDWRIDRSTSSSNIIAQWYWTIIRRRRGDFRGIFTETKSRWIFPDNHRAWGE
jgi:hypothetical protein